jgi:hypothetical protein
MIDRAAAAAMVPERPQAHNTVAGEKNVNASTIIISLLTN